MQIVALVLVALSVIILFRAIRERAPGRVIVVGVKGSRLTVKPG